MILLGKIQNRTVGIVNEIYHLFHVLVISLPGTLCPKPLGWLQFAPDPATGGQRKVAPLV